MSSLAFSVFKSRNVLLEQMSRQGFNVADHVGCKFDEVNSMVNNDQLNMLLKKDIIDSETGKNPQIYIRYYLAKINKEKIREIIDDLFNFETILDKRTDSVYIVTKEDMNDSSTSELVHIWNTDRIFFVIQSIRRLQFNILDSVYVPKHTVIEDSRKLEEIMNKYNISDLNQFPEISRFDPVSQVIGIKPGQVCEIDRPSKTSIISKYYRLCV
jgi:DNA-directed RNA polymerase subunit H (RpoH/RPB5)